MSAHPEGTSAGLAIALLLASASVRAEGPAAAHPPSPNLWFAPHALFDIGRNSMFTSDLGGSVMVVVSGEWRVGAAFDRSASVLAGVEGCSTSEFCLESRTRYAGRVEYHASPGETFAPWFALELGAERMNGYDTSTARYEPSNRTVPVILPQAGFDLLAPAGESRLGCGLFVGLPIGVAVGAQLGLRVVVGVM